MSLETEIAGLTSKVTALIDYFNSFRSSSVKTIADAVAAAPAIYRNFYVNSLIGDDNALGTAEAPFKTLSRAIVATPDGGVADIILQADYVHSAPLPMSSRRVVVRGDNVDTNTRKLTLNEYTVANGNRRFGGFQVNTGGSIDFCDLTVVLPDTASGLAAPLDSYYAMVYAGGSKMPGFAPVKLYNLVFVLRGTFGGKIVGPSFGTLALTAINCTIPSALEGCLITGVPAGKDPNTIPSLITNITKL
ncbi:hypothetical protein ACVW05_003905 [Pseudomonas fulva]